MKRTKVFLTNYHISVNDCLVQDLLDIGLDVWMPSDAFARGRIGFFAPNYEHLPKGITLVDYPHFISEKDNMAIIIPCNQLYDDFMNLYKDRGGRDTLVFLPALSNSVDTFALDGADFVMSHDLAFHRQSKAKYKILYFNKPKVLRAPKSDVQVINTFLDKKINLFINNFDKEGFEPEHAQALQFKAIWEAHDLPRIPFYGYGMKDGWLSMFDVQTAILDSMFTLVFKRRETWGQMVNESMLLGTPCIFLREFINSTFTEYLINDDTAIIGDTVDEIFNRVVEMSLEEYETLSFEARMQSEMFTERNNRLQKLNWLFDKVETRLNNG